MDENTGWTRRRTLFERLSASASGIPRRFAASPNFGGDRSEALAARAPTDAPRYWRYTLPAAATSVRYAPSLKRPRSQLLAERDLGSSCGTCLVRDAATIWRCL